MCEHAQEQNLLYAGTEAYTQILLDIRLYSHFGFSLHLGKFLVHTPNVSLNPFHPKQLVFLGKHNSTRSVTKYLQLDVNGENATSFIFSILNNVQSAQRIFLRHSLEDVIITT